MGLTTTPSGGSGGASTITDLDASANPNYPAAAKGDRYHITVAGKIGGASGKVVEVGDEVEAIAANAGGTQASVGASWIILQANIEGITPAGLLMIQAADASAQRTLLTLGTMALQNATAVTITGGTAAGLTGLGIRSTGAAFDLTLASAEVLTAGRTLTFNVGDAARTIILSGSPTLSGITTTGTGTLALSTYTLTVAATGTAALMTVSNTGNFKITGTLVIGSSVYLAGGGGAGQSLSLYGSESDATGSQVQITAHQLKLGSDLAGVTAKTITVGARASSDGTGANLTISPGNCRGNFAGGSLILAYYANSGVSLTVGILTTAMTINTLGSITCAGNLVTAASTTTISGLNIPSGTAPTSPVTGDMWYDGTNLRFRDGSTTRILTWV